MAHSSDRPPDDPDDLFTRARGGDNSAWEELFRRCYPKVIRVVRRKLNPPLRSLFDSTDFASDVMKSLAAKADRYEFTSLKSLIAFLEQVAEQKVIDEYRKAHSIKRDITRNHSLDRGGWDGGRTPAMASGEPTASQVAQASETYQQIVAGQSEPQRAAIDLKGQGYTLPEIAEQTGWSLRNLQRYFKGLHESHLKTAAAVRAKRA